MSHYATEEQEQSLRDWGAGTVATRLGSRNSRYATGTKAFLRSTALAYTAKRQK